MPVGIARYYWPARAVSKSFPQRLPPVVVFSPLQRGACMNWLNDNAAAIQALSGVAVLLVTAVLALLTARYVRLTREQVRLIRESARIVLQQNASALKALALRIRVGLGQTVSPDTPSHSGLRSFDVLVEQDIADLQALAKNVNPVAINSASDAAAHLRVIYAVVQTAKAVPLEIGWIPGPADRARWKKAVEGAHRALQEIETACHQVAET